MAEPVIGTSELLELNVEKTTSLWNDFTINHPRTAKVAGFAAVTAATLGVISMWKSRKQSSEETKADVVYVIPVDTSSETP